MKIKKPLMVKLSAGLLTACGIFLPAATQAGWTENDTGNFTLTLTSTQPQAVLVTPNHSATVQAGTSWSTFDPSFTEGETSAIIFDQDGRLVLNGGDITVNDDYSGTIGVIFSKDSTSQTTIGSLTVGSWVSASALSITNTSGGAYGIYAREIVFTTINDPPAAVNLAGALIVNASGTDLINAYGLRADNDITIGDIASTGSISVTANASGYVSNSYAYGVYATDGNVNIGTLAGSVSATAEDVAYGVYASKQLIVTGDLSGSVTATALPQGDVAVSPQGKAIGLYGNEGVTITGILSGSVTAQASTNFNGRNYRTDAIGIQGDLVLTPPGAPAVPPPVNITLNGIDIGSITGSVTATALIDIDDVDGSRSSYAYGLKSNASILIGDIGLAVEATPPPPTAPAPSLDYGGFDFFNSDLDTYNIKAAAAARKEAYAYGLYADGNITLGDVKITGTPENATPLTVLMSGAANIVATAYATDYVSDSYAYGVYANGTVDTGVLSGNIIAAAEDVAYAVRAGDTLTITGDLSGLVGAIAAPMGPTGDKSPKAEAIALYGAKDITITGDVSGMVAAVAVTNYQGSNWTTDAAAIKSDSGTISIGSVSGTIYASATGVDAGVSNHSMAYGIDAENGNIVISGNLSGTVLVNGSDAAFGLVAQKQPVPPPPSPPVLPETDPVLPMGDLTIGGDLSGTVTVNGVYEAFGLAAMNNLVVEGNITSTALITVTASDTNSDAYGLVALNVLTIGKVPELVLPTDGGDVTPTTMGDLAGDITVNAGRYAFGLYAGRSESVG